MKHLIFCILLTTTFLMTIQSAQAIVEARVNYGILASKPDLSKVSIGE